MPGITFVQKGDFKRTHRFLERARNVFGVGILDKYGKRGVEALASATPRDSGITANSWGYYIVNKKERTEIVWTNTSVSPYDETVNIAVIVQYGHATKSGSWIQGRDYINPAIQPIFDDIANAMWKEVTKK